MTIKKYRFMYFPPVYETITFITDYENMFYKRFISMCNDVHTFQQKYTMSYDECKLLNVHRYVYYIFLKTVKVPNSGNKSLRPRYSLFSFHLLESKPLGKKKRKKRVSSFLLKFSPKSDETT